MLKQQFLRHGSSLVLAAESPKCSYENCTRRQPARSLLQDSKSYIARCGKITQMKPCPGFVGHGFIAVNRAQSLCLLFVEGSLFKITGISLIHSSHMIGVRTAWAESNRLF